MYSWYRKARKCYVYLQDVSADVNIEGDNAELTRTRWATRGWTLQELLAPSDLIFYSMDWTEIGRKDTLSPILSTITGIDEDILTGKKALESTSVAKRMSWAARRSVTRPEDLAYCLMGIFTVNMPMLYGEGGTQAFLRLQEEIMKHSDDHSLFAWTDEEVSSASYHGLLATHPSCFKNSHSIIPYEDREERGSYTTSNRGVCIEFHLTPLPLASAEPDLYAAALDCPVPPHFENHSFLALYLKKLSGGHNQYARVKVGCFAEIHKRGALQTVYVRQAILLPTPEGIYPSHVFQLRKFYGHHQGYRVFEVMVHPSTQRAGELTSSKASVGWIPPGNPTTCTVLSRGETRASYALYMAFNEKERFLIILGSMAGFQIGFDGVELEDLDLVVSREDRFEVIQSLYNPKPIGSSLTVGYHRVRVMAETLVRGAAKYYMIDIEVDAIERPNSTVDVIMDKIETLIDPTKDPVIPTTNRRFRKLRRVFGGVKV